jgi:hypothetical protein
MLFDIERLVSDLGGAGEVSKRLNTGRTVPYGWIRRGSMSSNYMSQIKEAYPSVRFDQYFKGEQHGRLPINGVTTFR